MTDVHSRISWKPRRRKLARQIERDRIGIYSDPSGNVRESLGQSKEGFRMRSASDERAGTHVRDPFQGFGFGKDPSKIPLLRKYGKKSGLFAEFGDVAQFRTGDMASPYRTEEIPQGFEFVRRQDFVRIRRRGVEPAYFVPKKIRTGGEFRTSGFDFFSNLQQITHMGV